MLSFRTLQIKIQNWRQPLPSVEQVLDELPLSKFTKISKSEIEAIITIVLTEAKYSRSLGLFIEHEHLIHEILLWVTVINKLNGSAQIRKNFDFDYIKDVITKVIDSEFPIISKYYFDKISNSKPKITESNNAFQAHLESVRHHVLTAIFNNLEGL